LTKKYTQNLLVLMAILIKTIKIGLVFGLSMAIFGLISNWWIVSTGKSNSFSAVEDVDARDVALVLGTSRSVNGRFENPFFTYRMQAAAELYHAGKVKHILVSGDNSTHAYNEPRDMRAKLISLGVPKEAITMDFAGLRTLDSVIRSKKIFQQRKIVIISQAFHNYRALFIARHYGIDAVGYNADYPTTATSKTILREYLARPKAILDLFILGTQPKYLGEKIDIQV
jgi:SanA protein